MISKAVAAELNKQVAIEARASFYYLAMASWCDKNGYEGSAKFLYAHSDEERDHMLKLMHYINDMGGHAQTPVITDIPTEFDSLKDVFKLILQHEIEVTGAINALVGFCYDQKDFSTFNFLQWYLSEQHEEEGLFTGINDKFDMVGTDGQGLFMMDQYIGNMPGHESDK